VVSTDAGEPGTVESDGRPSVSEEVAMADQPQIPHQAPHVRGAQLGERLEDAAFLLTLFSGAAIVVAILLLFVVL
jgi:hypothetical protein